jgi:plasmid replication initiation protein
MSTETPPTKSLKDACKNLFERRFSYQKLTAKGNLENVMSRWVQRVSYVENEALVRIRFSDDVVPLITNLEKHFTSYELEQVSSLTSAYAIRLYELLIAWRSTGKVSMLELRNCVQGLVYWIQNTTDGNFKRRVLEPAIQQINEHTDIKAEYEQHKRGRSIIGFSFSFKQKSKPKTMKDERDPNTPDFFIKMTDSQRHLFANKMSEMPEMSKYSQGTESYQQFAIRIAEMLLQPEKFRELYPFLEKAGFKG